MKILILGASGFIGNACYERFSSKSKLTGVDLIDRFSKGLIIDPNLSFTKKIIQDSQLDVIINCAGSANIKESFLSPEKDFAANTTYVEDILKLLKENSLKTKFINISSAAVYGNPDSLPINENAPKKPLSPYGVNKLKSEEILKQYSKDFGIPTLSVRIFSAYGIGLKQQFFFDLYSKFSTNEKNVSLFGNGNESRDFVYISDIVEALNLMIDRGQFDGSAYNIASGNESFIKETAYLFANILDYKGAINFSDKQLEGYPLNWRADISKLKSLGFSPKINLETGLELYANWIRRIL